VAQIKPDEGVIVSDSKNFLSIVRSRGVIIIERVAYTDIRRNHAGPGL
jgi:hypothetical protein